jgi:hypothetical protein
MSTNGAEGHFPPFWALAAGSWENVKPITKRVPWVSPGTFRASHILRRTENAIPAGRFSFPPRAESVPAGPRVAAALFPFPDR